MLLPPLPPGTPIGSGWFNDFIEKVRYQVNNLLTQLDWNLIVNKPTTLAGYGITDAQNISGKDSASGYAGLNSASRIVKGVDTTDDVIVDDATNGLVLKDTQGTPHYWRVTVDNTGTLVISDLGTTKP